MGNAAYAVAGERRFEKNFEQNSTAGLGRRIDSTRHRRVAYKNAFSNSHQGFRREWPRIDAWDEAIGSGPTCRGQSGALSGSFSDVFGCLLKKQKKHEWADKSSWLIGENSFPP
jgi:Zn-dependent metalloprotease